MGQSVRIHLLYVLPMGTRWRKYGCCETWLCGVHISSSPRSELELGNTPFRSDELDNHSSLSCPCGYRRAGVSVERNLPVSFGNAHFKQSLTEAIRSGLFDG